MVLLPKLVKRFGVSRVRDFLSIKKYIFLGFFFFNLSLVSKMLTVCHLTNVDGENGCCPDLESRENRK